jgi:hypothetical protein
MLSRNPGIVDDVNYGVYIWRDGQGRAVVDADYNYMMIASKKDDAKKIRLLMEAARQHGIEDGYPEFCAGSRPISDSEWEHQKARQAAGEVPDEYDLGNLIDEFNYQKEIDKNG